MFAGESLRNDISVPRANYFALGTRQVQDLQPILQQPFYIGAGYTPDGLLKTFTVPAGATRLNLGVALNSTSGALGFYVSVSPESNTAPAIASSVVLNAAGFAGGPLSPGSLASVFGSNLGTQASAPSIPLPLTLGGTQVFVDDTPAPLVFVSPTQINFQLPASYVDRGPEASPFAKRSALVTVVRNGVPGVAAKLQLFPFRPGVFTVTASSWVAFNARTGQLANDANPSRPGDVLVIYASGVSPVSPAVADGQPAPATEPLARSTFPASFVVSQGGNEFSTKLLFSGLLPAYVGVHQLNAVIPAQAAKGIVDVFIQSPFGRSNTARILIE
jgi:uncharacterized protein (TIGR03437 family)